MTASYVHLIQRYPPALGGAESYFARLSEYLVGQHLPIEVHTTNAIALESFWRNGAATAPANVSSIRGVTVHRHAVRRFPGRRYILKAVSCLPHPWVQGFSLPASPQLPSLLALARTSRKPIRLIHASAFPYTFPLFCGLLWARRLNLPFLLTPFLHLGDIAKAQDRTRDAYLSPPLRYLLQQADRIFVQTELERNAVCALAIPQHRVVLQGLGVEPKECTAGNRVRGNHNWNLPEDNAVRIGHLANLSYEKGTVDLLHAACELHKLQINFRMVLAGPSMPNFLDAWRKLPSAVAARVHRLGILAEHEKPDFFAITDIFALPSRSDSYGLVLLEAWANGIPCIGYRAGGIAEVIQHETYVILLVQSFNSSRMNGEDAI